MTEQFANNASTTLNGGIDNVTTTVTVTNGSPFSSTGTYRIIIDSEIMTVTARGGNVMTVVRGQEGTSAVSHLTGATVTQIISVSALQQFRADNISVGTYANLPTVGTAGRLYKPTDGNISFIDTGSVWSPSGPTVPITLPPAAANFSIIQTGINASLVDDNGGLYFSALQRVGTNDTIFAAQNNPGGTGAAFTLTVGFIPVPGGKNGLGGLFNYHITGIGLYETSSTKMRYIIQYVSSTGDFRNQLAGKTGLTTAASTTYDVGGYWAATGPMMWFRIQDDGVTNRTWSISTDGRHFKAITIEARTTGFTSQPDKIGLQLDPFGGDAQMTVLSYSLTSP